MPAEPRAEANPQSRLAHTLPVCRCLFNHSSIWRIFLPTPGFSHEISSCPVFPRAASVCSPFPLSDWTDPDLQGLTTAFQSAWVSHKDFFLLSLGPQWPVAG